MAVKCFVGSVKCSGGDRSTSSSSGGREMFSCSSSNDGREGVLAAAILARGSAGAVSAGAVRGSDGECVSIVRT